MRGLIHVAVRYRVTVFMLTAATVLFGLVSLGRLPLNLLPEISYPTLTLQTEYPDSAPSEVEALITRPLEEAIGVVPGLRRIESVSHSGQSEISLEFGWHTDMDFAALDVREKMDRVTLPRDARPPVLLRYDPALDPVMRLGLSGNANLVHLRHLAEQVVKKELESMQGVAAAKIRGGLEEEVHVDLDDARLAQLGVPIAAIASVVGSENINAAGGRLRDRSAEYLVRTLNQFEGPQDVAQTIVFREGDRVVKLGDIAEVSRGAKEREIVSRIDGKPAVEISVYKEGDANIVAVAKRVQARLEALRRMLPEGVQLTVLADQARYIRSSVSEVQSNAIVGGLLAVGVLLLFLGDLRSTGIIAIAIPTSLVSTFALMFLQGVSLNIMSLGGLALAVGMLVDNSIVVLESIVRHRRQGDLAPQEAVVQGTSEVGMAVTASTLTTVAVFLPILFVEGVAGQIFRDQALTVTYALIVSLLVSLTLTPMLAALGARRAAAGSHPPGSGPKRAAALRRLLAAPARGFARGYARLQAAYPRGLNWALAHKPVVLLGTTVLFALAVAGMPLLGTDLIPAMSQGEFRFDLELPEGTPIEQTDQMTAKVESAVRDVPSVATVFTNVGVDAGEGSGLQSKKENHAELNVKLLPGIDRAGEELAIEEFRRRLARYPQIVATLERPSYFSFKTPIAVEIFGYDLTELQQTSDRVVAELGRIDGLRDVASNLEPGSPEVRIRFDRDRLRAVGVELRSAAEALRTRILGTVVTDFKERDRQIDVLVRGQGAGAARYEDLENMVVGHRDGRPIRVAAVADLALERGPARIVRVGQSRAAVVSANLEGRDLGGVSREIEAALRRVPTPAGVTMQLGGQNEEMRSSFRSMLMAILLAVFLVYMVMASQFESLLDPLLILLAVPMALIGVVAALLLTRSVVSVVVLIGGIVLAGIVVNNGIVLVDLVNQLRGRGAGLREALLEAGSTRLRPIMMTTTTTVLGLLPMALGIGEGAEIRAPLAITVIAGLCVSTVLTLIVMPVLYAVAHRER